jgi:RimJ/RimL family protein N-acetyltransferase
MDLGLTEVAVNVPVIETERLRLRAHRLEDFETFAAIWADPDIVRHITGKPLTREESWAGFLRHPGHWSLMGFGYWVVEEKSSGRLAGNVGFGDFRRELTPSLEGMVEAGWVMAAWAHGKGFAREACLAAHAWIAGRFGPVPTVCMIAPENAASLRLAEKLGYHEFARATYKERPSVLLRREAKEAGQCR